MLVDAQLRQAGLLVVAVELAKIHLETRIGEEAALQRDSFQFFAARRLVQAIEAEHVCCLDVLAQAHEDVVAEDQGIADPDDVAGDTVVLGARAQAGLQLEVGAAEGGQARFVKLLDFAGQDLALLLEALPQQFVAAASGNCGFDLGAVCFGLGHDGSWCSEDSIRSGSAFKKASISRRWPCCVSH